MQRRLYFAYGSNMDETQMLEERCPGAILSEVAKLPGYRFLINTHGVATIIPNPESDVYGALWSITPDDEESLDRYEGVKHGHYRRDELDVESETETRPALVYIATNDTPGSPSGTYMKLIIDAAIQRGLPEKYLRELRLWKS